jgi:hypothetical protein
VKPVPRTIYGTTKVAAEDLCELFHRDHGLACLILRTSRFFPEEDDRAAVSEAYAQDNVQANEFLYRRVDLEDVAAAHMLAIEKAPSIGFGRYIVSATTPFSRDDLRDLRVNAPLVVGRRVPGYEAEYARRGWRMFPEIERVYVNERARRELGWQPRYDFRYVLDRLDAGADPRSPLARAVGSKGYHTILHAIHGGTMATKRSKGPIQRIVDTIGEVMRQPLSDESYEVQTPAAVSRSESVAAGTRRGKTTKARTKKGSTKKRKTSVKAAAATRKKKR